MLAETGDSARPWTVRSNIVASQTAVHREWGGVVPELASRQHLRDICGVVDAAIAEAGTTFSDIGAVAGAGSSHANGDLCPCEDREHALAVE